MSRLATLWVWLVFGFMYLPIAMILLFSLNASDVMAFPLRGFTTEWYGAILSDGRLGGGFLTTLSVAFPVAILVTVFGAIAALVLTLYPMRGRGLFVAILLMPFLVPRLILAVSQLILFKEVGIDRSLWTVIAGQSIIILPFSTLIIASVLIRIDRQLIDAAADLGASGWSSFRRVVLPLMSNGLLASWVIAFVLSSSEYVMTAFLSGREQPLSVLVASDFRFNLSPSLNALAVLIVLGNIALVVLAESIRRRSGRND
ncbi:ABC transporter permease [Tropicimonas isoalkanivorans]|uniref:Spermidine/putrescine transport system permease protein n=1 Tax=Tropicimonas isoalkanivorans TaxID=441112 RepID=A0A1I1DMQ5_9RHOB|nr:ABC transporter permease [Tropicimonas isoalkanivorans]SFB74358.1 spermidine/putrescine transport system permease protein [Tropicimonas isoalkanivorans]